MMTSGDLVDTELTIESDFMPLEKASALQFAAICHNLTIC